MHHTAERGASPGTQLLAGLAQHRSAQRHDQAALFSDRDEDERALQAVRRVIPAGQRLQGHRQRAPQHPQ